VRVGLALCACLSLLASVSCGSLETPSTNTVVQAKEAAKKTKPRLDEALLSNHGLQEIWYLSNISSRGSDSAELSHAWLLDEGVFVVTKPNVRGGGRHLVRIDRGSGETIWYEDLIDAPDFVPTAYHYPETSGKDPELYYTADDRVVCLDLDTGRKFWEERLSVSISTPVVANENSIFVGSDLKKCFGIPKQSTVESWSYVTGGKIEAAPLIVGDKIVFASHDGMISGLVPTVGFDTVRSWELRTGGRIRGDMTAFGRFIFAGSEDLKLYCVRPDGQPQWSYGVEARVVDQPCVFRVKPNLEFVFVIGDKDPLRRAPRALLAIPLARGNTVTAPQPVWRVENVRKVVTVGKRVLYVLMEPGDSGDRILAALDLETGKERFRIDLEGWNFVPFNNADHGRHPTEPGRIYLISQSGALQVIGEKPE